MPGGPDPAGPGRDEDPAGEPGDPVPAPDVTAAQEGWLAWSDAAADHDEPPDQEEDPGSGALAGFAAEAAGDDDRYDGACDDEVAGAISAWDRIEAHASARKHAAVAELIRWRKICIMSYITLDWDTILEDR